MKNFATKKAAESEIQSKTIAAFERAGWLVVKYIQTNKNGWPDLQIFKDTITLFIECKKEGKSKTEPLQEFRKRQLLAEGFVVILINDLKEIQNAVKICNAIPKK